MAICLERGVDLHMVQLMPLPLTVPCFGKIQIGFTFLVLAYLGSPRKRAIKRVCVCVCLILYVRACFHQNVMFVVHYYTVETTLVELKTKNNYEYIIN